jgi:hypothetical protein
VVAWEGLEDPEGSEVEDSKVVGFNKGIRVEVGEAAEGGAEGGDRERHLDISWRFEYKTTIPRKLPHEINAKSSRSRVKSEGFDHTIWTFIPNFSSNFNASIVLAKGIAHAG